MAWIAVRGAIDSEIPVLISLFVLMWTSGFDIMYACQDDDFDRKSGLRSIPARFGVARSLWMARLFHIQAWVVLLILYLVSGLGVVALVGVGLKVSALWVGLPLAAIVLVAGCVYAAASEGMG